jgi:type II secretory pathway pseudopilin PulG
MKKSAFTLVEILTVLALMMLIIGGGLALWGQARDGTLRQQTKAQLSALAAEIEAVKVQTGSYPNDLTSFANTADGWGNGIVYAQTNGGFTLSSLGEDGLANTSDDIIYDSMAQ